MKPERLPKGKIRIPRRAVSNDGTIGDGSAVIGPDDPAYEVWDKYLTRIERE